MIDQVGADILAVQEVGSMASLTHLNNRLAKPYAESCVVEGNSNRAIHLGVLSRFPVRVTSHRERHLVDPDGEERVCETCKEAVK